MLHVRASSRPAAGALLEDAAAAACARAAGEPASSSAAPASLVDASAMLWERFVVLRVVRAGAVVSGVHRPVVQRNGHHHTASPEPCRLLL